MRVLVLNAGSSTLKASVLDGDSRDALFATTLEWGADATRAEGRDADFEALLERLVVEGIPVGSIEAIGHRVVHGGTRFTAPTLVDDEVLDELDGLADLAPLHNPVAVETIRAALVALPGVPEAAAFDTAFHASLPAGVHLSAARRWIARHGLRRFGFHGLSVEWATSRAAELLETPSSDLALVVAHLGSGCSVTAVDAGRSAWTSMGMTPLEGLMMGTRSGSVDPGILLRLLHAGVTPEELDEGLEHGSGLLGVAGSRPTCASCSSAWRQATAAQNSAIELFVRRAAEGIAAAATALPRLDGLVFTGGIGEHAAPVRARIVGRLGMLGMPTSLGDSEGDAVLADGGAGPAVLRVAAREDLVIAEATRRLLD